jgi:four helix bundle protein
MGFERFRAYDAARQLRAEVDKLFDALSPESRAKAKNMISHVNDAVDSIQNNIAEGNDSKYPGKKDHFFDVAIGSCEEARNGIRSMIARKFLSYTNAGKAVSLAAVIPKMLRAP